MLPADSRMRRAGDFGTTVKFGVRRRRGPVTVHIRTTHQEPSVLVGFVVPKSVGTAPRRNLVKRRLRALMRPHLAELSGVHVVVRAAPECASVKYADLGANLDEALGAALGALVASSEER